MTNLHTPFEMESEDLEDIGGVLVTTATRRLIMCSCLPADEYPLPYGHHDGTAANL
jgi:hypothetical protein